MADNKNHHYVPQFYFKIFAQEDNVKDPKLINGLLKKDGKILEDVSISDQASKNYFYVSKEVDLLYSNIEGTHRKFLSALNKIDSIETYNKKRDSFKKIFQVVLFQYVRTLDKYNRSKSISEKYTNELVKKNIKQSRDIDGLLQTTEIKKEDLINNVRVDINKKYFNVFLNELIAQVFIYQEVITDLGIYILNNETDKDFIFSDNPVVFYNLAFEDVKTNSMVALQSPGLMIFYPISKKKCILLLDEENYSGDLIKNYYYNITKETDINIINKVQIHNCTNAIYFSKYSDKKNISRLYRQERKKLKLERADVKFDGKKLMIIPERINYKINLSFINRKTGINKSNIKYRSKKLYELMNLGTDLFNNLKEEIVSSINTHI